MKSHLSKIILIVLALLTSEIAYAGIADISQPKSIVKEILIAKDGTKFEFRERYEVTKNSIFYEYDFGNSVTGYKRIYQGKTYTDSENCPHDVKFKNSVLSPKSALIKHSYLKRDFNFDGIDDVNLSLAMEICKTKNIEFVEYLILSTDKGFNIVQYKNQGEK